MQNVCDILPSRKTKALKTGAFLKDTFLRQGKGSVRKGSFWDGFCQLQQYPRLRWDYADPTSIIAS
jgi:hypothetical protein